MRKPVTFWLAEEALDALHKLAKARGAMPEEVLEQELRRAAQADGLLLHDGDAFLILEAVDEMPAIGPEGRGKLVRLKAVDETGEMDVGEIFVTDAPDKTKA